MRVLTGLSNHAWSLASVVRTAHLIGSETFDGSRRHILGLCATRSLMRSPSLARNPVSVQPPPDGQTVLTRSTSSLQDNTRQASNQESRTKPQRRPWSEDELRIVEECDAKGMTVRAIANCLEGRTYHAVHDKVKSLFRGEQNFRNQGDWAWSTADKRLLCKLREHGFTLHEMHHRFPTRSYRSLCGAVLRFATISPGLSAKPRKIWTPDEDRYLKEAASKGAHAPAIA